MSTRDFIEKDYYAALGVAKDADPAAIKKAYRALARDLHPDKNPGNDAAEARFKEVSEAYDVLSDPTRRSEYDEARRLFGSGGFRAGGGSGGGFSGSGFPGAGQGGQAFDLGDLFGQAGGSRGNAGGAGGLGDIFGGLFGGGGAPGGTRSRQQAASGPARGQDVETEATLAFDEAVLGVTVPLRMQSPGSCPTCHGSGAKPGTSPHACPVCHGAGVTSRSQGAFAFSEPCRQCRGSGSVVDDPCSTCKGSGITDQTRTITVRIPAGVKDGQRIRLAGKGAPGRRGGPAGDLFVVVHVSGSDLFGRKGNDLTLEVPVTFAEATLGTTLTVPTLDTNVSLRVPPGTASGRTFRVRGRGVQTKGVAGDLLVTVVVTVPDTLSPAAREAVEALATELHEDPRPHVTAAVRGGSGS
ncbi:molecular chaperone DnaJ [Geodermatophilus sp. Leaf369]|jgi:molecular chaperone DnaJ|uniref:molecular chaperone DnaJ n=1 Tax=Geodermatophilus sp. Leaf369 TaxID=1736354 RepID=UPI0006FC9911|nr:molecular chaperone DnaJ [Geodermatophilus sp. Leaf369]KQS58752.1 molecular chaperone DnaJ [Geodermatophilus sp. Leaf369]QNG36402.1 molecular chaperone DnaJ [Geodermatophilaceae bacterium NBWT11]